VSALAAIDLLEKFAIGHHEAAWLPGMLLSFLSSAYAEPETPPSEFGLICRTIVGTSHSLPTLSDASAFGSPNPPQEPVESRSEPVNKRQRLCSSEPTNPTLKCIDLTSGDDLATSSTEDVNGPVVIILDAAPITSTESRMSYCPPDSPCHGCANYATNGKDSIPCAQKPLSAVPDNRTPNQLLPLFAVSSAMPLDSKFLLANDRWSSTVVFRLQDSPDFSQLVQLLRESDFLEVLEWQETMVERMRLRTQAELLQSDADKLEAKRWVQVSPDLSFISDARTLGWLDESEAPRRLKLNVKHLWDTFENVGRCRKKYICRLFLELTRRMKLGEAAQKQSASFVGTVHGVLGSPRPCVH
jgi:hypothetical protein